MSISIAPDASPAVKDALTNIQKILERGNRHAADPADASNVATLLREAASFYDVNDIEHGRKCLLRGFEYAQVLRRQGLAKQLPATPSTKAQTARIDNLMLAMRLANEPTLAAIAEHHDTHQFLDTFADEW